MRKLLSNNMKAKVSAIAMITLFMLSFLTAFIVIIPFNVHGSFVGEIGAAITDVYEYDTEEGLMEGQEFGACRVNSSDYYIVVGKGTAGTDADGYIRTLHVWNNNGTINKTVIDSYEFDTFDGACANVQQIPGTHHYLVSYRNITGDRTTLKTIRIWDENGTIKKSAIDTQVATYDGHYIGMTQVYDHVWAIAYEDYGTGGGATYDGFLETFWVNDSGTINNTVLSTREFDVDWATYPYLCMIDTNTIAITYVSGSASGDFTLKTFNITTAGAITTTPADTWNYETDPDTYSYLQKIGTNKFLLTFCNQTDQDLWSHSIAIANDGKITKSWIDSLKVADCSGVNGMGAVTMFTVLDPITATDGAMGAAFSGLDSTQLDGYITTWNVSNAGAMSSAVVDTFEYNTTSCDQYSMSCVIWIDANYFLIFYTDQANDGYITTLTIATTSTWANRAPTFSSASPTNSTTGVKRYHATNVTVSDLDGNATTVCFYYSTVGVTGPWTKSQQNNTVTANTTVRDINSTYSSAYNTQYWWKITANDGTANSTAVYTFTTETTGWVNRAPTIGTPSPANGSTGVSISHATNITISDLDGNSSLVCFWYSTTAVSGPWTKAQQNNSITANTTARDISTAYATSYDEQYWWKVSANDGTANSTAVYTFTTKSIITSVNPITPYLKTTEPITVTATGPSDLTNVTLYYRYSDSNFTGDGTIQRVAYIQEYGGGNLYALDVTNLSDIHFLDSDNSTITGSLGMYIDIDPVNKILYATDYTSGATADKLYAFNISDPTDIKAIMSIDMPRDYVWGVQVNDNDPHYVYVGGQGVNPTYNSSITIVNATYITNVSSPDMYVMKTQGYGAYADLVQDGDYLYASSLYFTSATPAGSIAKWDISDPTNLTNVSRTNLDVYSHFCFYDFPYDPQPWDYIFIRHYKPTTDKGFLVVNVTNDVFVNESYVADSPTQYLSGVHYLEVHHNNITGQDVLFAIGFTVDSWVSFNLTKDGNDEVSVTLSQNAYDGLAGFSTHFDYCNFASVMDANTLTGSMGYSAANSIFAYCVVYGETAFVVLNVTNQWDMTEKAIYAGLGQVHDIAMFEYGGNVAWQSFGVDSTYPWSWNFDCPNGTGYYEFYSVGQKSGSTPESAPGSADAILEYAPAGANTAPTKSTPVPATNAKEISINPTLSITLTDADGDPMDVIFQSNATGIWNNIGFSNNHANGSVTCPGVDFTGFGTKYWWRIIVDDDNGGWCNATFNFTTTRRPNATATNPASGATGQPLNFTFFNMTVADPDGDTMHVYLYTNHTISGYWLLWKDHGSLSNGTISFMGSHDPYYTNLDWDTKYWWALNITDGKGGYTNYTYNFTTMSQANLSIAIIGNYGGPWEMNYTATITNVGDYNVSLFWVNWTYATGLTPIFSDLIPIFGTNNTCFAIDMIALTGHLLNTSDTFSFYVLTTIYSGNNLTSYMTWAEVDDGNTTDWDVTIYYLTLVVEKKGNTSADIYDFSVYWNITIYNAGDFGVNISLYEQWEPVVMMFFGDTNSQGITPFTPGNESFWNDILLRPGDTFWVNITFLLFTPGIVNGTRLLNNCSVNRTWFGVMGPPELLIVEEGNRGDGIMFGAVTTLLRISYTSGYVELSTVGIVAIFMLMVLAVVIIGWFIIGRISNKNKK